MSPAEITPGEAATETTGSSFDSPEQEVFLQLWRTYDCLMAIEADLFSRHDLSSQQYNVLRLLQAGPPEGMQTMELGRLLISRSPDMTRMLDRLEKRGLIERVRQAVNRRVVLARLTPAGQLLLRQLAGDVVQMHQRQVGHLAADQQRQLVKLLKLARAPHEPRGRGQTESNSGQSDPVP